MARMSGWIEFFDGTTLAVCPEIHFSCSFFIFRLPPIHAELQNPYGLHLFPFPTRSALFLRAAINFYTSLCVVVAPFIFIIFVELTGWVVYKVVLWNAILLISLNQKGVLPAARWMIALPFLRLVLSPSCSDAFGF